jgi:hypothetical protein
MPPVVLSTIKREAALSGIAGAKHLGRDHATKVNLVLVLVRYRHFFCNEKLKQSFLRNKKSLILEKKCTD